MPPRRPADLPRPAADQQKTVPAPAADPDAKPAVDAKPVIEAKPSEPAKTAPSEGAVPASTASTCVADLIAAHGPAIRVVTVEAGRDGACGVVEPVQVEAMSIGPNRQTIAFQPPVTLSCAMAKAVAVWLETSVQPLAKGYFAKDLTAMRVGGGHECRRRNRAATGRLSEHSTGAALDVFAVTAGDGKANETVVVEKPDGPGHGAFLAALRQSACGAFMTSLGPGSDAAHANHLHVDIQPRRAASSRFCQ